MPELFEGGIAVSAGVSAADQVYLDYSTPLFEGQPEAGASDLLGAAPGDALGAFALADHRRVRRRPIVDLFERANEAGADLEDFPEEGIAAAFEDETGVSFDDAAAAIGDAQPVGPRRPPRRRRGRGRDRGLGYRGWRPI